MDNIENASISLAFLFFGWQGKPCARKAVHSLA